VYKISRSWMEEFFMSLYLESCIWPDAISRWMLQQVCECATETLTMIRGAFGEENISRTRKVQTHRDRMKVRRVKGKVKSMLISFFDIKGVGQQRIRPGRPSSQFRVLLWRFTETAWKCAKTSPRWKQNNHLLHHDNAPSHTSFPTRTFFIKATWL
jgi:hypothetical protein